MHIICKHTDFPTYHLSWHVMHFLEAALQLPMLICADESPAACCKLTVVTQGNSNS